MATGSDSAKEGEDDEEKGNKGANGNKEAIKKAIKKKVKQTVNKGEEHKKKGAHMWSVGIDTT